MMNDEFGCNFFKGGGMERYWHFYSTGLKRRMVKYEYIHTNNAHFRCIEDNLEAARAMRDKWLKRK